MKCAEQDLLLYAVTDRHWLNGRSLRDVVEESLRGGVTMLQLREKSLAEPAFLAEARELQALCRDYHVPFIVNDNVDIALAMDADGVHVGQSDMEALDVRRKLGPDKIIGVSAQTVEQALLAEKHGADYLGVGAVFPTGSKDDAAGVEAAARTISQRYGCAVLCKGGHQINDADDLLWRDGGGKWFRGRRIPNPNTHGTGCTLSSAIAANLAKGYDLDQSVERAKAYISGALAAMLDLGRGSGPMNHMFDLKGGFAE